MAAMTNKRVVAWSVAFAALLGLLAPLQLSAQTPQIVPATGWTLSDEEPGKMVVEPEAMPTQASEDSASVAVGGLYNRMYSTNLTTTMGGATIYVAGQFLRDQKTAYLVLSSPRLRSPMFFNLLGLLDNEVEIGLGGTNYKISLEWSVRTITNRMAAEVKIKANDKASFSCTLQTLLDNTFSAGQLVTLGGVEHRLGFYSELTGAVQGAAGGQKTYALMSHDPKDPTTYFTYLFPEEDLASGGERTYVFKDRPYKTMRVTLSNGTLQIRASR
jgi:hypothetical protein